MNKAEMLPPSESVQPIRADGQVPWDNHIDGIRWRLKARPQGVCVHWEDGSGGKSHVET